MQTCQLTTRRLCLRQWQAADLPVFAELNADPAVMEYFPRPLQSIESDAMANKCQQLIADRGWGFWAVSLREQSRFIGFAGLHQPSADLPFAPCVEVGWRLHRSFWGQGYATEAATEALRFAFEELALDEVVAFSAVANQRSRAVMARLGMTDTRANFRHPDIDPGHPLCEHVLYKITRSQWQAAHS
ncbi:GNAT family N-acetyltransferase [Marinobacter sp. X15-166B]|uniref:GNAT family N-acetyltransferase n=1 Tax=Marinobacter sp. X15-166B TaxID=1897620 RepID=UPI00085BC4E5|nr:GNAT family N-acetyltransferase [Marinobacter sp. X15-166B]OEY67326.1 GNAT family N-acetyltransferase [Marinobacter sp. X15-166B]